MKNLPESRDLKRVPDPTIFDKVKRKLEKSRAQGYLRMSNEVKYLTNFFLVPKIWKKVNGKKVADNIRTVYDAIRSGLNEADCAPWLPIPTVASRLCSVEKYTYMVDCNIGEIFLNFMLELSLRPFAGLDLTFLFPEDIRNINETMEACWE